MIEKFIVRPKVIGFLGIASLSIVGCQTTTNTNQPEILSPGENQVETYSGKNLNG
jgi:hypothetical protein